MKKPKLIIDPHAFDSFTGTQEELDELIKDIYKMWDEGTLFEDARPLTEEEEKELMQAKKPRGTSQ